MLVDASNIKFDICDSLLNRDIKHDILLLPAIKKTSVSVFLWKTTTFSIWWLYWERSNSPRNCIKSYLMLYNLSLLFWKKGRGALVKNIKEASMCSIWFKSELLDVTLIWFNDDTWFNIIPVSGNSIIYYLLPPVFIFDIK